VCNNRSLGTNLRPLVISLVVLIATACGSKPAASEIKIDEILRQQLDEQIECRDYAYDAADYNKMTCSHSNHNLEISHSPRAGGRTIALYICAKPLVETCDIAVCREEKINNI